MFLGTAAKTVYVESAQPGSWALLFSYGKREGSTSSQARGSWSGEQRTQQIRWIPDNADAGGSSCPLGSRSCILPQTTLLLPTTRRNCDYGHSQSCMMLADIAAREQCLGPSLHGLPSTTGRRSYSRGVYHSTDAICFRATPPQGQDWLVIAHLFPPTPDKRASTRDAISGHAFLCCKWQGDDASVTRWR